MKRMGRFANARVVAKAGSRADAWDAVTARSAWDDAGQAAGTERSRECAGWHVPQRPTRSRSRPLSSSATPTLPVVHGGRTKDTHATVTGVPRVGHGDVCRKPSRRGKVKKGNKGERARTPTLVFTCSRCIVAAGGLPTARVACDGVPRTGNSGGYQERNMVACAPKGSVR